MGLFSLVLVPKIKDRKLFMRLKREVTSFSGVKKVKIVPHISIRATFETKDIKALSKELSTLAKHLNVMVFGLRNMLFWR